MRYLVCVQWTVSRKGLYWASDISPTRSDACSYFPLARSFLAVCTTTPCFVGDSLRFGRCSARPGFSRRRHVDFFKRTFRSTGILAMLVPKIQIYFFFFFFLSCCTFVFCSNESGRRAQWIIFEVFTCAVVNVLCGSERICHGEWQL